MSTWSEVGTVFVVDDDEAARMSVAAMVDSMGLKCQGFASCDAFLEFMNRWVVGIGVALVDVRMKGTSGLLALRQIRGRFPTLPVVMVTAYADVSMAIEAMEAGALSLLEKPYRDNDLWELIVRGMTTSETRFRSHLELTDLVHRYGALSISEAEVLKLLIGGVANKQIAHACEISLRSVDIRRKGILEKMGTSTVAELIWKLARSRFDPQRGEFLTNP
jgi:FixJ family two-component response regulator